MPTNQPSGSKRIRCIGCRTPAGSYHRHCAYEECPFCHGPLASCGCIAIQLDVHLGPDDVLTEGERHDLEREWQRRLRRRGRIRFGQETNATLRERSTASLRQSARAEPRETS